MQAALVGFVAQVAGDPGLALINAMKNAMAISSKELGDDIGSLTPAGITQLSLEAGASDLGGARGEERSEKGGTINKMLQSVDQQGQKGLPPQQAPLVPPAVPPPASEGAGSSISSSARKPDGSERTGNDKGEAADAEIDDNPMGVDYDGDENEEKNLPPEKRDLPFNSPYHTAAEFGIVEKTTTFMGFSDVVDAELFVPALRLDLEGATVGEVDSLLVDGLMTT